MPAKDPNTVNITKLWVHFFSSLKAQVIKIQKCHYLYNSTREHLTMDSFILLLFPGRGAGRCIGLGTHTGWGREGPCQALSSLQTAWGLMAQAWRELRWYGTKRRKIWVSVPKLTYVASLLRAWSYRTTIIVLAFFGGTYSCCLKIVTPQESILLLIIDSIEQWVGRKASYFGMFKI